MLQRRRSEHPAQRGTGFMLPPPDTLTPAAYAATTKPEPVAAQAA